MTTPRVLITSIFLKAGDDVDRYLTSQGMEPVYRPWHGGRTEEELIEILQGVEGVIASSDPFTARVLQAVGGAYVGHVVKGAGPAYGTFATVIGLLTWLFLGARVVVLSRSWKAFHVKAPHLADDPAISCHQGDVRDFAFPDGRFSHVIDAVTESSGKHGDDQPLAMLDTVIAGTRRTLDFARHCGAARWARRHHPSLRRRWPVRPRHRGSRSTCC